MFIYRHVNYEIIVVSNSLISFDMSFIWPIIGSTNAEMERRKSRRSKRPMQSEGSTNESSDDEVSSGSRSTTNSRRTSPKKTKRAARSTILQ